MVMMMTAMTNKTTMKPTSVTIPMPLPTRDDYRHGMNKLRHQIDCPVLSPDDQAMADELRDYDWSAQTRARTPAMPKPERPTVDDYLKKQYQANMLARYPEFEATTETDIATLQHQMSQMYVFNMIVVMLLGLLLILGGWMLLMML